MTGRSAEFFDAHLRARDHAFPPNPAGRLEQTQWEKMASRGSAGFKRRLLEGEGDQIAEAGGSRAWPLRGRDLRPWEKSDEP